MNYWQFKVSMKTWAKNWNNEFNKATENFEFLQNIERMKNKLGNNIDDIIFYYNNNKSKKYPVGIYLVCKIISNIDKKNNIRLKVIKNLKQTPFNYQNEFSTLHLNLNTIKGVNKRQQTFMKIDNEYNPQKLHNQLIEYQQDGNLVEDIKSIELDEKCSTTEKESLIKARIGQGNFRNALIEYWNGCSVTNYQHTEILIASHIKPWKNSANEERLDLYNGLLLLPNIDKLFDKGYISFDAKGKIMLSKLLSNYDNLGIDKTMKIKLDKQHHKYLEFHREFVFKK